MRIGWQQIECERWVRFKGSRKDYAFTVHFPSESLAGVAGGGLGQGWFLSVVFISLKFGCSVLEEVEGYHSLIENLSSRMRTNDTNRTETMIKLFRKLSVGFILACSLHQVRAQTNASATTLPEVVVTENGLRENRPGFLQEEQLIGENQQPEWTTRRRFATTRAYVISPWQVEFEQWWKGKFPRQGDSEHLFQSEVELGLPYRFQLDVYENLELNGSRFRHQGNQVEGRWALADWGKIFLNPTIYGEWKFNDHSPDAYELKLLLAQEFAPRWHWAFNVFYEQEVGGGRGSESGFSQALSYSVADEKLSVGVEMNLERQSEPNLNGSPAVEFLIGPSVQWRPCPRVHLDLVPLVGTTGDSPRVEAFVVFGFDFGKGGKHEAYMPASSQAR